MNRRTMNPQPASLTAIALRAKNVALTAFAVLVFAAIPLHAQDRHAIAKVAPLYPPLAKQMHITGVVRVLATIDASGKVTKAESPSGNKLLALSAIDCVKQWKFTPGEGVDTVIVELDFEN